MSRRETVLRRASMRRPLTRLPPSLLTRRLTFLLEIAMCDLERRRAVFIDCCEQWGGGLCAPEKVTADLLQKSI